jgi:hypothetical protein
MPLDPDTPAAAAVGAHDPEPIRVWRFEDAPPLLRALSSAGDEDWLALIPPHLVDIEIDWMESGSAFGPYRVSEHTHRHLPGYKVRVGTHA